MVIRGFWARLRLKKVEADFFYFITFEKGRTLFCQRGDVPKGMLISVVRSCTAEALLLTGGSVRLASSVVRN